MKQLAFDVIGKICTKCGEWKPLDHFHKHQSCKYGCRPICKVCRSVPKTRYQFESRKLERLGFRLCRQCKQLKSLKEFYDHGIQKGRYYICKNCMFPNRLYNQERNQLFQEGKKRCNTCNKIEGLNEFRFRADRQTYEFECKTCRNSRAKEYDAKNPEKARARNKRWLDKQLAKDPDFSRKKYAGSRDEQLQKKHEYYHKNHGRLKAYSRQYYRENKEKVLAYQRKYNAEHPDKTRARKSARRTRETKAGGSFTAQEWKGLCEKYGNKCLCCGATDKLLTVDHVVPVSRGGSSNIENLQCLCRSCNCQKHNKTIDHRPQRDTAQLSQTPSSSQ